ncbi:transposase [Pelomicrobium sp.]|uniref:transposase n=1 Tax=Pelomicrobium sp. TaxID=2815319 RepID=UPI003FA76970
MARSLIRGRFSMRFWEVLLWRLLRKPRPSSQRPLAEGGMRLEYPRIGAQAGRLGAQIVSVDEAAVHSGQPSGILWAPMGGTPVLDTTAARFRLDMLSAFSPRGLRFMPSEQRLSAVLFIEFLQRRLHVWHPPFFLIAEEHSVHRSGAVRRFVASTQGPLAAVSAAPRTPAQPPRAGLEPPQDPKLGRSPSTVPSRSGAASSGSFARYGNQPPSSALCPHSPACPALQPDMTGCFVSP